MAAAVLDIEFEELPLTISGLDGYSRALILIRLRGQPVGKAFLPVVDGQIDGAELHNELISAAGWPLWERWLHDYLEWDETYASDYKLPTATVAVCTRDRPEDLKSCLEALTNLPDGGQEILVVDNCPSTDTTHRLVEGYDRVNYVREDQPGLNVARNRALREAQHDIVAFTDDDTTPDPDWLRGLLRNFNDPMVLCVTGLTMPLELESEAQEWFERYCSFTRGFRRTVFDSCYQSHLTAGRVGAGANMALHKRVLELIGPFDEALDAGTPTCSGGDTDMFSRILAGGFRIVYDPAALNWHRHRKTWEELRQTIYGYGVGVYAYWTRIFLAERNINVFRLSCKWFFFYQLPAVIKSLLRLPDSIPLDLLLAELRGCITGPRAYLSSRKRLDSKKKEK
jgi:glycosyltransferase involved in cell wall biosynthesis